MAKVRRLKLLFYVNALIVALLVAYKIYLNFFEQDFSAVHADQVERIEAALAGRDQFRFAVVGNINNSIGIFERRLLPMLNASGVDFVVSAGNAVSSGGEDKYRALYRTLSKLNMPYLLTFGSNEESRLGSFRFYDHFGPYLYSFSAGNSRFVFLDSTGTTSFQWQLRWLEEELMASTGQHRFVFSEYGFKPVEDEGLLGFEVDYLLPASIRTAFVSLLEAWDVDAVFSASLPRLSIQHSGNTDYVLTGGGGGFMPDTALGYHHYIEVSVNGDQISLTPVKLDVGHHPFWRTMESLWFFIHSLFYVGYLNFILLIAVLLMLAIGLYTAIFVERDYYPDFDIDPEPYQQRTLKVAMFSNNFLPFIGGVPISIDRLRRGLKALGHQVLIVAPTYGNGDEADPDTVRVRSLLPLGKGREFRLANIFLPTPYRRTRAFAPDLIHVHHPFWLGSAGVLLARRLRIPVVYTYHTRLEHYAHFVPLPGPLFRNLVSHALVRRFANRCDGVVVPTQSAEEYLRMIGVKRPIFVQPTGIDYARFQDPQEGRLQALREELKLGDEKLLISISRLSKEKNIGFMIDALSELAREGNTPFRCLILGAGGERARLQQRIDTAGLNGRIQLLGAVPPDELPLYCQLADLFVFASRSETQGMVILEAMAAGVPVVAVRSSGIDDIVIDGHNGFKTPLNRARWRERVAAVLNDEELHQQLSKHARECAAEHSIEAFSSNMSRIYASVLAAREAERPGFHLRRSNDA
jgi:glycosyltransferase involved in cell wall biosynthesis